MNPFGILIGLVYGSATAICPPWLVWLLLTPTTFIQKLLSIILVIIVAAFSIPAGALFGFSLMILLD